MSWQIEIQNSGLFIVATQVGKPMLEGVFRAEVPHKNRMKVLHQIAEAPAMEALLETIRHDLKIINEALALSLGEGALGQTQARQAAPRLFELVEAIDEQLSACSEK